MYDAYYGLRALARDLAEIAKWEHIEAVLWAVRISMARLPANGRSQKTACAYEVHARSWGKSGKYTGGYV